MNTFLVGTADIICVFTSSVSTGPSAPPLRPDTGPLNIPGSSCSMPATPVKEEDDNKDGAEDSSDDNDNQAGGELEG